MIDKTQNPAEIYLITDTEGDLVWCDTPAPGEGMREEDATRYVREDIYLALQAQVEQLKQDIDIGAKDYCGLMERHDALFVQVDQLREVLRYADNKLYILTHNRKDVSLRLLTDADKAYKAVHDTVLGFKDDLHLFVAKRDAEIKAQAGRDGFLEGVRQMAENEIGWFGHDAESCANHYASYLLQQR